MDDRQCRITVVGTRRRVDLAVPSQAPIADYITPLTRMYGEETDETSAILSGIALAASAALATRRGWPVPAPARLAMALALCPIFALAGYTLPAAHNDPKTAAIAVASGAALGALTALLAIPGTYTLIALLFTVASLPVTLVFAALLIRYPAHADAPPATGPLLALGTATIIIAVGLATPQARTRILNTGPSWTSPVGIALSLITIPLTLGVFGVFQ